MALAFENIFKKFNFLVEKKKNEVLMASVFKWKC